MVLQIRLWFVSLLLVVAIAPRSPAVERGLAIGDQVEAIVAPVHGRVGVAVVVLETGETYLRGAEGRHPMQSVYKLPIALAVLAQVDAGALDLEQTVKVEPHEYVSRAQHSPLRDRFPAGTRVTVAELGRLAVSESDGSASDVLLRLMDGPARVMTVLEAIGVEGVHVVDTEREIGRDEAVQYRNWASPAGAVGLLRAVHEGRGLSPASRAVLWDWLTESATGRRRIKAGVPPGTLVAHKTGSSRTIDGAAAATNDIGIVVLPDGRHLAIAVFVTDARGDMAAREAVIAGIARVAWDAATGAGR